MTVHELKILPEYFEAVITGEKSFEVRNILDRTFEKGDELVLKEFDPERDESQQYSGRELTVRVTYVLNGIVYKGTPAVVMSIVILNDQNKKIKDYLGDGLLDVGDFRDGIIRRG